MIDLFSGPRSPLAKAFAMCGWATASFDILISPDHDLTEPATQERVREQAQAAIMVAAAFDCSTKSRAREIPRHFPDGRPMPRPLRSKDSPMGLPGLVG